MSGAEALRKQALHRLAEELLAGEAEEPLGLGVDEGDAPVRIDDHDGVGGRFEEGTERRSIGPEPVAARRPPRFGLAHAATVTQFVPTANPSRGA